MRALKIIKQQSSIIRQLWHFLFTLSIFNPLPIYSVFHFVLSFSYYNYLLTYSICSISWSLFVSPICKYISLYLSPSFYILTAFFVFIYIPHLFSFSLFFFLFACCSIFLITFPRYCLRHVKDLLLMLISQLHSLLTHQQVSLNVFFFIVIFSFLPKQQFSHFLFIFFHSVYSFGKSNERN